MFDHCKKDVWPLCKGTKTLFVPVIRNIFPPVSNNHGHFILGSITMLQLCTQNFNATAMDVTGGGLNFFLNYCFPFLRLLKKFLQSSNWLIHKVSCVLLSAFQFHSSLFVLHKKWKRPKGFYQHSFNMCKIIEISWLLWVGHVAFQSCFRNQSSYNCFPIRSLGEETKRKWTIPLTLQFHSGPVILLSFWGHLSSETLRKGRKCDISLCFAPRGPPSGKSRHETP